MKDTNRKTKLKSALRQNLRKRKAQTRKLSSGETSSDEDGEQFSMKLRSRDINTQKSEKEN